MLKMYFDIANTGELSLIQRKGRFDAEKCAEAWEEIVRMNSEANNSTEYMGYLSAYKSYDLLLNEFTLIRAMLMKLQLASSFYGVLRIDQECVKYLNTKGYRINTEDEDKYAASLEMAIKRAMNFVTKITMKRNELMGMAESDTKKPSFAEAVANLNAALGFSVDPDTLTLSMYNEYKKVLKKRNSKNDVRN